MGMIQTDRVRWMHTAVTVALACAGPPLAAQQAAQPGDSIRVRFDTADVWHYGLVTDRSGDTLVVRGCAGCRHDPFVVTAVTTIEALRARESSSGYRAIIGLILGAGAGAALGGLGNSGCTPWESNQSGPKCSGTGVEAGALLGGIVGAVAGAVSGRVGHRDNWKPTS